MTAIDHLFPGFESRMVAGAGADIHVRIAERPGAPAVLCLHGYPETHAMWHRVAPVLARTYTVVCADLRGYGMSSAPPDTPDHSAYSKRAMAADMLAVMRRLGHERFAVVGHDRGARVAYRLALDAPETVIAAVSIDVIPTLDVWETIDRTRMMRLYHWAYLAQPAPFPEIWLAKDPDGWLKGRLTRGASTLPKWVDPAILAHDQACFRDPAHLAASCADYRAGATIDVEHDRADRAAGQTIASPFAVYWGTRGNLSDGPDAIETWSRWCARPVVGKAIESGHFVPEENPDDLIAALMPFLARTMETDGGAGH